MATQTDKVISDIVNMTELRNWLVFLLAAIGAFITIRTYINATRQRKIDNTFKTLEFLRRHISESEIRTFIDLFHANNELSGVRYNEFKFQNGRTDTIETMFSEGGVGNGDIHNMIELFNLISPTLSSLELNIIWYEYGQIMSKVYSWTKYLEDEVGNKTPSNGQQAFYTDFNTFMKLNSEKMLFKPTKYYTYAE